MCGVIAPAWHGPFWSTFQIRVRLTRILWGSSCPFRSNNLQFSPVLFTFIELVQFNQYLNNDEGHG